MIDVYLCNVDRAVAAARRAFDGWSRTTPRERGVALLQLADLVERHASGLAAYESANAGKPLAVVRDDELPRVFDDIVARIAAAGFYNAGQDCTAATRVLAARSVYDDVVAGLAREARACVMGDTTAPSPPA